MKRIINRAGSLVGLIGLTAPVFAQGGQPATAPLSDVLVADGAADQIVRFTDYDGNFNYDNQSTLSNLTGEVTRVVGLDGGMGTGTFSPRDMDFRVEGGVPVLYWIDTVTDILYRGADSNFNGRIDADEVSDFRDIGALDGASSPDGVFLTDDGKVWWTSDSVAAQGLFCAEDTVAPFGEANTAGEQFLAIPGDLASSIISYATDGTGTATPTGITIGGAGALENDFFLGCGTADAVVAWSRGNTCAIRVEDKDDSNSITGDEAILMLNPGLDHPLLPQNADFAAAGMGSTIRSLEVVDTLGATIGWAFLDYWGTREENGNDVFYFSTGVSNTSTFGINRFNEPLNGLVFRGEDLDGDGDLQDAGDVTLWYDGSQTTSAPFVIQQIVGLAVADDGVYVYDLGSGGRWVHRLRDDDRDGNAEDVGEQDLMLHNFTVYNPAMSFTPPFEFTDFLFVNNIEVAPAQSFASAFQAFGTGCAQYGPAPEIGALGVAHLNTADYSATVSGGIAAAGFPAVYSIGNTSLWLGVVPLPFDLSGFGLPGCTLYSSADLSFPAIILDGSGFGVQNMFIPNDGSLVGLAFGGQWLTVDVFTTFTSGLSDGGRVRIAP